MRLRVSDAMVARFFDCTIHSVYATFAIVEHAEYASRVAILPFIESHEDAVGSAVAMEHHAAARVGALVRIDARIASVEGRAIVCDVVVTRADGTVIARGTTTQRVVSRARLADVINANN